MSIVIITIPGVSKQSIVQRIQEETDEAVSLVVVQTPKPRRLRDVLRRLVDTPKKLQHLWYGLLLRLHPSLRAQLETFRARTPTPTTDWTAPTYTTTNINSPKTIARVQAASPTVLAVWGSTIISPELTRAATHAINLHLGCAPQYRGAIANQRAVQKRDLDHIGYTVHYINGKADAGAIIDQACGSPTADPVETFTAINDAAEQALVTATVRLYRGEQVATTPQDISHGENVRLREWTPYMRYHVATTMKEWQDTGTPSTPPTT